MKAEFLHHVSLPVADLKRSKWFYGEVLGLKETNRPAFDFEGAWYQIGEGQLHLILDKTLPLEAKQVISSRGLHFALRVDDYDKTVEWLRKHEVTIVEKPHSKSGFAQIFCCDPDGHIIELHVEQPK
ncbi:VOC family protein [Alkalihalobacillus sp. MEB130]|uniref:VOC family protein n=1 Tax=Alkalihalobacillus sp. MEB130 TaxID=2976704 RepID=UPI0028DDCF62|nr:VOC family protein [Alkalihalobacillus sp. MEB130]MDT8861915.1 VOC family protein [Alkalihalobacillus sp. MEB130]